MAEVLGGNQVKLDSGQTVTAQTGGWYDGQQFWNGSLSQVGSIHAQSDQQGAGQAVSQEVIAQTNPKNVDYINQRRQAQNLAPSPTVQAPAQAQAQAQAGSEAGAGIPELTPQPALNLPELYKTLTATSGIGDLEKELSDKEKAFTEATGVINDNPFLSEGTRVGRVAKLDELFQKRTANLRGDIATKKADIETQLNLETKQFDINSQIAQQELAKLDSFIKNGWLDNASGEDIAQFTRTTGVSSNMIRSAIDAGKKKDVSTSTISFDDGTNQGFAIINTETGEIISKQNIAASKSKEYAPKAEKEVKPENAVGQIVGSYLSDQARQAQISPEDFYRELLLQYPAAADYINENWSAKDIRKITGQ